MSKKNQPVDAYKQAQEQKKNKALELLRPKPETWSEEEREIYGNKTMINMLMTNRMVLLKHLDYKNETESGIIMVENDSVKPLVIAMVVSIAPDCRFGIGPDGKNVPCAQINAGDIVNYAAYNGQDMYVYGERFFLCQDMNIHAKIPDSQLAEVIVDKTDHLWTIRKEMTYDEKNPNNIGPKSKLHVDNYVNKLENKRDKLN